MSMTILTVAGLADLMNGVSDRALDPDQRFTNETDAVLYGKLIQLSALAENVWVNESAVFALTYEENITLSNASNRLSAAFDHLVVRVFPNL